MRAVFICLLLLSVFCLDARIIELEDKEGRKVMADVISLRDGILTFRRVDAASLHHFPVSELSRQSVALVHREMTQHLVPSLRVSTVSNNRRNTTHWRNTWGEYSRTTTVERVFAVDVSSTSAFRKEVDVFVYWYHGGKLSYFVTRGFVGGDEVIEIVTSEKASQRDTRYDYYYSRDTYTVGDATVELVVLIKDLDNNVLTSWATRRSVEDIARKRADKAEEN